MSTPLGTFDQTLVPLGWFDYTAQASGWFDSSLLDGVSITGDIVAVEVGSDTAAIAGTSTDDSGQRTDRFARAGGPGTQITLDEWRKKYGKPVEPPFAPTPEPQVMPQTMRQSDDEEAICALMFAITLLH